MRNYFIRSYRGSPHKVERDDGAQWVVPSVICTSHFCGKNYDTADARYLAYVPLQKYARKNRISRGRCRVLLQRWPMTCFLPRNKFCNLFSYVTSWVAISSGVRRLPFFISVASRIKMFESNMPPLDFPLMKLLEKKLSTTCRIDRCVTDRGLTDRGETKLLLVLS